ncbi:MAG: molybdopterin-dependent oxidoreductase, partial [Pseudomonadota bacterium]
RAVNDPPLGPLVETHMTRCISCTRCVRFMTEVAGVPEMGQTGRGEDSEIISYEAAIAGVAGDDTNAGSDPANVVIETIRRGLSSEMQGNIVDLCPVGALTSKPYAFTARPWELTRTNSVDVMDALGAAIRIDTKGREVMRILPRNHDGVNEEWLGDRSRYCWDGLKRQRLDRPYVRENGKLRPASWDEAFRAVAGAVEGAGTDIAAVAGDMAPVEAIWALKGLMDSLGGRYDCRQDGAMLPAGNRSGYVGTATIADTDEAGAILLVGTNPRREAPVLNARIRKAWMNGAEVATIAPEMDLSFETCPMGDAPSALVEGRDGLVGVMSQLANPLVIVGQAALARPDGEAVLASVMALCEETGARMLVLHQAAARVGAMDIGFTHEGGVAGALDGAKVIYNLGADEMDMPARDNGGAFVIYHGSHGDRGAHRADVILPGAAFPEQSGLFVNTEGRVQMAARASFPPGDAREDWAVLRALSGRLSHTLPFDSLDALRAQLFEAHPHFTSLNAIARAEWTRVTSDVALGDAPFAMAAEHFLVNPVARASQVLAECSRLAAERREAAPIAAE